ncbi:MAG: hypothetical protein ACLGIA_03850 [Actinomycetes bacterium]
MTEPSWADDEHLLAELGQALAAGAPDSEKMTRDGYAAFTWRTVDAELAVLGYDSLLDDHVVVRGVATVPRRLVFDAADTSLEIEISGNQILGQLVPPRPAEITVVSLSGESASATADEAGCFTAAVPGDGPFRVRSTSGPTTLLADWVRA